MSGRGPISRAALIAAAVFTIAIYLGFVLAWRSDKPAVVAPPGAAITTAVRADHYALQANGFLKGQLHLDLEPPAALVAAKNPYDPKQRPPVLYLHDSSLFRGRYYIYFGPAPALLLFAPWKLVTGHDLPTPYAVFVFVSLAYLGLLALFRGIAREYYPDASRLAQWAGVIALGGATMLIPLVRRPGVYEVAIACGCAAMAWGLVCAWRSRFSARPLAWAAACGTLFGLAVAARPTLGLGAFTALMIMLTARETGRWRLRWDNRILAASACGALFVGALLAYNYARFANPFEFGQKYQLSGAEEGAIQHFSPRFVGTQAWFYLAAPLQLTGYFPFLRDVALPEFPAGFGGHEYSFGVVANFPIAWFALVALAAIALRRPAHGILAAIAAGTLLALTPLLFFFGSCVRYQAEFTPPLILLASLGVLEAEALAATWRPRLVRVVSLVFAVVSAGVALFASVDMYNAADNVPPRGFDRIGRWLNQPAIAFQAARGRHHGPVRLTFQPGAATGRRETLLATRGPNGAREALYVERIDARRLALIARRDGPEPFEHRAEVETTPGATHELTVSMSSFYPVRPTELPAAISREDFRALKTWTRVDWHDRRIIEEAAPLTRWRATHVAVAPPNAGPGNAPFSGRILALDRLPPPVSPRSRTLAGVRLRVSLTPEMTGRSFPLGVTGQQGRGNFLILKITQPGQVQLGYDHWGKPAILSAPVAVARDGVIVIEFWMPSILSADAPSPLLVRINDQPAWEVAVPFYPAGANELFIARNPLGGSACERELPGATIESTRLPPR